MTHLPLLTNFWKREKHLHHTIYLAIIASLMISYIISFPHLMKTIGPAARLFPTIYLLLAALVWGMKGGLAIGAVSVTINLMLHHEINQCVEGGIIGPIIGFITILLVGRLSDLHKRLATQLSERKKVEEHLQTNEKKFRLLFEMESSCLALIEKNTTRILEVNQATTKLFGYSREELLNKNAITLSAEPEASLASIQKEHLRVPIRHLRKKDGTVFPAEIVTRHFELEGQKVFLIAIRDISKRLETAKQLRLTERQHQQSQKLQAIGTLAGGIAHDFNNILGAILGYTDLLQLMETQWNKNSTTYLGQIRNATHRAKDLINQILTFSRQSEVSKRPVLITPIIREALELLHASIPSGIEIRPHFNAEKDVVIADATQIHQIIVNLCTNAYHAISSEKGMIDVTVANTRLDEKFAELHPEIEMGSYLQITVADTGDGMNQEVLEQIFQPYFSTKKDKGSGLGLSVVHGIVHSHKGCITVESEPGKGTSFHVVIPLAMADVEPLGKMTKQVAGGTERILLLDDDPTLLEMSKNMLEMMGYAIESRTSGLEALELIKKKPHYFDLIITDMNMPNMTGIEFRNEIARIIPDLPIIAMTGFSEKLDPEKALKLGFKKLIMKPVSFHELTAAVREVLDDRMENQPK